MNTLGLDPGTVNFGWSVNNVADAITPLACGILKSPIRNLTANPIVKRKKLIEKGFADQHRAFYKEIYGLVKKHKANRIIVERFQTRNFKGKTIEAVGIMIGVVATIAYELKVDFTTTMAATWKNAYNKAPRHQLEDAYKEAKEFKIAPHVWDATMMCLYGIVGAYGYPWVWKKANRKKLMGRIAQLNGKK